MESNFITNIIDEEMEAGKHDVAITRFPPEPNGYLHIGHAKAITINFDIAKEYGGYTYLRFDDTNPAKEDQHFIDAIQRDIAWLGFSPKEVRYASDYFDDMFERALILIDKGLAYVDDLNAQEIREYRGTLTQPGKNSPYRDRSIEENRDLFLRMREGEFEEGEKVLRAKIDMASPNLNMRDPVIYRILKKRHYRTGDKWNIYPMYDFAHPLEDAKEGITHSLCSLEFEDNRPLYNWFVEHAECEFIPRQIEFAKLNLSSSILGKRNIIEMVEKGIVDGWDDPRLLTLSGLRRRGYTPASIVNFIRASGVAKADSEIEYAMLEHFIREDLSEKAPSVLAVLDPVKVVITNYEEDSEILEGEIHPKKPEWGNRGIPFSGEIYIEREDIKEKKPNKKYKRLAPGLEVRLKFAYFIKCNEIIKDKMGKIVEVHCTYDPKTKSGTGFNERKPNGTIHWVDAKTAIPARFYRYDKLIEGSFDKTKTLDEQVNQNSKHEFNGFVEPYVQEAKDHAAFQFYRQGFFTRDDKYEELTFNETVSLKSSYRIKG